MRHTACVFFARQHSNWVYGRALSAKRYQDEPVRLISKSVQAAQIMPAMFFVAGFDCFGELTKRSILVPVPVPTLAPIEALILLPVFVLIYF